MKRLIFILGLLIIKTSFAQVYIPAYGNIVNQVSQTRVTTILREFEALGVKERGTVALENTLTWLKNKYLAFGYTASELVEDPFTNGAFTGKNLVVTKTGTLYPNTFIVMGAHYDSRNGPGTNDNGSGTACMLEMARLLQDVPTEYSIKFIHFSGEEDGLVGSEHYVNNVVNATTPKLNIRLMFNIDQVGGVAGAVNDEIQCERDESNSPATNNAASNSFNNELINCVGLYSPLGTNVSNAYGSDYVPFEDNNEVIVGLYETNETAFSHTVNDLLVNMDTIYNYNVAKAATGALLHFAVAITGVVPVTLVDFTGNLQGKNSILSWRTTAETNNKGFEIERSANQLSFQKIGYVAARGINNQSSTYQFIDDNILIGLNYYRLKQIDLDGNYVYSRVVTVKYHEQKIAAIYPNPVGGQLNLINVEEEIRYQILNSVGQVIQTGTRFPNTAIPAMKLPAGTYYLNFNKQSLRFIKQ